MAAFSPLSSPSIHVSPSPGADNSVAIAELTQLANACNSDKGTSYRCAHNYTRVYGDIWAPVRATPLRLLEIGLNRDGGRTVPSLEMWRAFFSCPRAEIHGFDIVDLTHCSDAERSIVVWQGDQGVPASFHALAKTGLFDIVIDDGSHASQHQQTALAALWASVRPGGWYVIEDLHWQPAGIEAGGCPKTKALALDWQRRVPTAGGDGTGLTQDVVTMMLSECSDVMLFDSHSRLHGAAVANALLILRKA